MPQIAYVNGRYIPLHRAMVSIEDRGNQFADGIYEVISVRSGVVIDLIPHLERLRYSLEQLDIQFTMTDAALSHILHEVIRRNRGKNGILYVQISRGVARRAHSIPLNIAPTLIINFRSLTFPLANPDSTGSLISTRDIRWLRADIKSISLLPNVLAKNIADKEKYTDAVMSDEDGNITECSASNIFYVKEATLITRSLSNRILGGITRNNVVQLAKEHAIKIEERLFTLEELYKADEIFITSTTKDIIAISKLDNIVIPTREKNVITKQLQSLYQEHIEQQIMQGYSS